MNLIFPITYNVLALAATAVLALITANLIGLI